MVISRNRRQTIQSAKTGDKESKDSSEKLKHLKQYIRESGKYSIPDDVWKKLPEKDRQAVANYNRKLPKMDSPREQGPNKKTPLGIHKAICSAKSGDMLVKGDDGKL